MQTLLIVLIGLWLLKGAYDLTLGILQILLGILAGAAGLVLYLLSFPVGALERLWDLARGSGNP